MNKNYTDYYFTNEVKSYKQYYNLSIEYKLFDYFCNRDNKN